MVNHGKKQSFRLCLNRARGRRLTYIFIEVRLLPLTIVSSYHVILLLLYTLYETMLYFMKLNA